MSISDQIIVMNAGVIQQIGKPQEVYDQPVNLFVAKFLGTPPINVFRAKVEQGVLFIGQDAVMEVKGVSDQELYAAVRPEGFVLNPQGPLCCRLDEVEVMGRDITVVSKHEASENVEIRSIIRAEEKVETSSNQVRFSLNPNKLFLFAKEGGERIFFEAEV